MKKNLKALELTQKSCRATGQLAKKLNEAKLTELLKAVPRWYRAGDSIQRKFDFENYFQTMAFVNALAWIAHNEDHHPDLVVGYNACTVTFSTHSAGGLTENDFICAARVDALRQAKGI